MSFYYEPVYMKRGTLLQLYLKIVHSGAAFVRDFYRFSLRYKMS